MRRRLPGPGRVRSAAFPLHRHSLAQLAIDGVLVAVAYVLAYRLRFDSDAGLPERYDRLLHATLPWAVGIALVVFTIFRLEQKQWRYTGHRDYLGIVEAVVATTLGVAGVIALTKPVTVPSTSGDLAVTAPTGVLVLFALLLLALNGGARFVARSVYERP
ncbi:MAG TPA: polysaccharide biosynthesis protein, partial [Solirubrobacteraceae bacterium]